MKQHAYTLILALLLTAGGMAFGEGLPSAPHPEIKMENPNGSTNKGSDIGSEKAREILNRTLEFRNRIASNSQLSGLPEARTLLLQIDDRIAQAQESFTSGNYLAVINICKSTEPQLQQLSNLTRNQIKDRPTGSGLVDEHNSELIKSRVDFDLQKMTAQLEQISQKLAENQSQDANAMMEKVKGLLEQIRVDMAQNRFELIKPKFDQIESLFREMYRIKESHSGEGEHGLPGFNKDRFNSQQPSIRSSVAQSTEIYNRVQEKLIRLSDKANSPVNSRSDIVVGRVSELLEKSREALANGQSEPAKEFALKADAVLAEWQRNQIRSPQRPTDQTAAALERLKIKFERALEIVKQSGNGKAIQIMEKGMEHLEKAKQAQTEGQTARVQVEMDISLKLAAKAVDIARSGQSR